MYSLKNGLCKRWRTMVSNASLFRAHRPMIDSKHYLIKIEFRFCDVTVGFKLLNK